MRHGVVASFVRPLFGVLLLLQGTRSPQPQFPATRPNVPHSCGVTSLARLEGALKVYFREEATLADRDRPSWSFAESLFAHTPATFPEAWSYPPYTRTLSNSSDLTSSLSSHISSKILSSNPLVAQSVSSFPKLLGSLCLSADAEHSNCSCQARDEHRASRRHHVHLIPRVSTDSRPALRTRSITWCACSALPYSIAC